MRALRAELAATSAAPAARGRRRRHATVEERLDIQEQRIEEQAQTKVEASQKFPIRLDGHGAVQRLRRIRRQSGGVGLSHGGRAPPAPGTTGATVRQTILGLEFRGPRAIWGGKVHGSVYMDFFAGAHQLQTMRMRTGSIEIDWKDRSVMAGLEKPIFNPREPSSLAQVGISPLTGAGNLWLWLPQVRFEQDVALRRRHRRARAAGRGADARGRPVRRRDRRRRRRRARRLEGRFEFYHNLDDERRLEIAPGFHTSTTHAGGYSIPSNLVLPGLVLQSVEARGVQRRVLFRAERGQPGQRAIRQGFTVYRGRRGMRSKAGADGDS